MPLLPQLIPKKLILPSSKDLPEAEQEFVVLKVGPLLGADVITMSASKESDMMLYALTSRIVEWNVKDASGQVCAVSADNVRQLPIEDMGYLLTEFMGEGAATSTDPKVISVN